MLGFELLEKNKKPRSAAAPITIDIIASISIEESF